MKIITWNSQGYKGAEEGNKGYRYILKTHKPDVLCLQECGVFPWAETKYGADFNTLANRLKSFVKYGDDSSADRSKEKYNCYYYELSAAKANRCNMAIMVHQNYHVEDPFVIAGPKLHTEHWNRPVIGVKLSDNQNPDKGKIIVCTTHFPALSNKSFRKKVADHYFNKLTKYWEMQCGEDHVNKYTVVFAGDFNEDPGAQNWVTLLFKEHSPDNETHPKTKKDDENEIKDCVPNTDIDLKESSGKILDYMFMRCSSTEKRNHYQVERVVSQKDWAKACKSDHYPVEITLKDPQ